MLGFLMRFILPLVGLYFIVKSFRNILAGQSSSPKDLHGGYPKKKIPHEDVIEMCPTCGSVKTPRHSCYG